MCDNKTKNKMKIFMLSFMLIGVLIIIIKGMSILEIIPTALVIIIYFLHCIDEKLK